MTRKGRPVIDKIMHDDRTAWNEVLLTSCNVSRKHWWDELEEAMGNTANFEGGTLYALQSLLTICGVFEKNKDEALSAISQLDSLPVLITKCALRGRMMHTIAVGETSSGNYRERLQAVHGAMAMKWYSKSAAWLKVKQPWVQSDR